MQEPMNWNATLVVEVTRLMEKPVKPVKKNKVEKLLSVAVVMKTADMQGSRQGKRIHHS